MSISPPKPEPWVVEGREITNGRPITLTLVVCGVFELKQKAADMKIEVQRYRRVGGMAEGCLSVPDGSQVRQEISRGPALQALAAATPPSQPNRRDQEDKVAEWVANCPKWKMAVAGTVFVAVLLLLIPPFKHVRSWNSWESDSAGHAWVFDPPSKDWGSAIDPVLRQRVTSYSSVEIDVPRLCIELAVTILIGGTITALLFMSTKNTAKRPEGGVCADEMRKEP